MEFVLNFSDTLCSVFLFKGSAWELVFLLNPVYVTLFWAVVLNFYNTRKHPPKAFLGKFMVVSFVVYLSHLFYFSGNMQVYYYLDSMYLLASLLVYPLYHIYVRLLTVDQSFAWRQHTRFLVLPFIVFMLYFAGHILMSQSQHKVFIEEVSARNLQAKGLQQYMVIMYVLARVVFIGQVFYYLYANFRIILKNHKRLQDFYSNTEDKRLQWVQFFNFSLALTSIASIAVAVVGRDAFATGHYSLAAPSVVFSFMLFFIGLLGNTQNRVHDEIDQSNVTEKQLQEKEPSEINDSRLKQEMEVLFAEQMIFKDPQLKIWDVCKMIGTNRTYISRFINTEYQRNFCNHVNHYRTRYVKKLLQEDASLKNDQLAEMAGFGSVNSLYRAFQTEEGKSLSKYRKQISSQE